MCSRSSINLFILINLAFSSLKLDYVISDFYLMTQWETSSINGKTSQDVSDKFLIYDILTICDIVLSVPFIKTNPFRKS